MVVTPSGETSTRRSWSLDLPPSPYTTSNTREHWTARSELAAVWRKAAWALARQAKIPPCVRIRVELHFWPPDRRRRDPDNLVTGVLKPVVDGLVDAKVVPDDTAEYVTRAMPIIHPARGDRKTVWRLVITDLSDQVARR